MVLVVSGAKDIPSRHPAPVPRRIYVHIRGWVVVGRIVIISPRNIYSYIAKKKTPILDIAHTFGTVKNHLQVSTSPTPTIDSSTTNTRKYGRTDILADD